MPSSTVELPYELWSLIASYLSKKDIRNLFGLNRVCTAVALDERYRTLNVGLDPSHFPKLHPRGVGIYSRLKTYPSLANRVRELCFQLHSGAHISLDSLRPRTGTQSKNPLSACKKAKEADVYVLQTLIQARSAITTVRLQCEYGPKKISPIFNLIAFACTNLLPTATLRTLILELPEPSLKILSFIDPIPNLRVFQLAVQIRSYINNAETEDQAEFRTGIQRIAKFTNTHRRLLREWGVTCDSTVFDLTPLFNTLLPIPHLHTLTFYAGYFSDPTSLQKFYTIHSKNIRSMNLLLPYNVGQPQVSTFTHHSHLFHLPFPALHTLNIDFQAALPCTSDLHLNLARFIRNSSPTLSSLSINQNILRTDCADDLVHALKKTTPLYSLQVEITGLLVETVLFDVLAERLPNLRELRLIVHSFPPVDQLFAELADRVGTDTYVNWQLRYLSLDYSRVGTAPAFVEDYLYVLRNTIPMLQSIDVKL